MGKAKNAAAAQQQQQQQQQHDTNTSAAAAANKKGHVELDEEASNFLKLSRALARADTWVGGGKRDVNDHDLFEIVTKTVAPSVVKVALEKASSDDVGLITVTLPNSLCIISDLCGFTKLSEKYIKDKDKMQMVINAALTPVQSIAHKHGLELLNTAGDALIMQIEINEKVSKQQAVQQMVNYVIETNEYCKTDMFVEENIAIKHGVSLSEAYIDIYVAVTSAAFRYSGDNLTAAGDMLEQCDHYDLCVDKTVAPLITEIGLGLVAKNEACNKVADMVPQSVPTTPISLTAQDLSDEQWTLLRKLIPPLVTSNGLASKDAIISRAVIVFTNIIIPKPVNPETMQKFYESAERARVSSGGALLQLLEDDKGIVLIMTFGVCTHTPLSVLDDAALLFCQKLEQIGRNLNISLASGACVGNIYKGPVGTPEFGLMIYTTMGFEVNLCARYAGKAKKSCKEQTKEKGSKPVQITYIAPTVAENKTDEAIICCSAGTFEMKGCKEPVEAITFDNSTTTTIAKGTNSKYVRVDLPPIGIEENMKFIINNIDNRVPCIIEGDTGCGKTLMATYIASVYYSKSAIPYTIANTCQSRSNEVLFPWKMFMSAYLRGMGKSFDENNTQEILSSLVQKPELKETVSVITELASWLPIEECEEVKRMDKDSRASLLQDTVFEILRVAGTKGGFMLILDDIQWFDEKSFELVSKVASARIEGLGIIMTSRKAGLENFETKINPAPEKVNLSTLLNGTQCLQIACRTLALSDKTGSLVVNYDKEDEQLQLFGEKLFEETRGSPHLVAQTTMSLQREKVIAMVDAQLILHCKACDVKIEGLQQSIQNVFRTLSAGLSDLMKYAALMGTLFDEDVLNSIPEVPKCSMQEAIDSGMMLFDSDRDSHSFAHGSVPEAIVSLLTVKGREERYKDMFETQIDMLNTNASNYNGSTYANLNMFSKGMGEGEDETNAYHRVLWKFGQWCTIMKHHQLVLSLFGVLDETHGADKGPVYKIEPPEAVLLDWYQPLVMSDEDKHLLWSNIVMSISYTSPDNFPTSIRIHKYARKACQIFHFPVPPLETSMFGLFKYMPIVMLKLSVDAKKRYKLDRFPPEIAASMARRQSQLVLVLGFSLKGKYNNAFDQCMMECITFAYSKGLEPVASCTVSAVAHGCVAAGMKSNMYKDLGKLFERSWSKTSKTLDSYSPDQQTEIMKQLGGPFSNVVMGKVCKIESYSFEEVVHSYELASKTNMDTKSYESMTTALYCLGVFIIYRGKKPSAAMIKDAETLMDYSLKVGNWRMMAAAISVSTVNRILSETATSPEAIGYYLKCLHDQTSSPFAANFNNNCKCSAFTIFALVCIAGQPHKDAIQTALNWEDCNIAEGYIGNVCLMIKLMQLEVFSDLLILCEKNPDMVTSEVKEQLVTKHARIITIIKRQESQASLIGLPNMVRYVKAREACQFDVMKKMAKDALKAKLHYVYMMITCAVALNSKRAAKEMVTSMQKNLQDTNLKHLSQARGNRIVELLSDNVEKVEKVWS